MDFQREKLLKEALKDDGVKSLVEANDISKEILEMNVLTLGSYVLNKAKCNGCKGTSECKQNITGLMPSIDFNGTSLFTVDYKPCEYQKVLDELQALNKNLITLCCNLDFIDSKQLKNNDARKEIYSLLGNISEDFLNGKAVKGLYINGPYGCGKSYIMSCFAKKLAECGKKVVFAYYPDLVREIKSSIGEGTLEDIVDLLKEVDVLVLDDFGGELSTPFIRDEVLGAILQERMDYKRLTFMTSNLDEATLHAHLAETKDGIDNLKASRIEERILALMNIVSLKDKNYRHK